MATVKHIAERLAIALIAAFWTTVFSYVVAIHWRGVPIQ